MAEIQEVAKEPINSQVDNNIQITDKDMETFFGGYLTIDEETILILNQKPKMIDSDYWEAYGAYKIKTNQILGSYLSAGAKDKLEEQYIHDDFHYPRLLEMNNDMITGFSKVEEAVIISKYVKNDYEIYEVMVTAIAHVIGMDKANERYKWDERKGYYDISSESIEYPDKVKVTLKYLVETVPGETFVINSVKENTGIYLGVDEQTNIKNNSFMTRVPYVDQVKNKDKEKINQFLDSFMKQDYNFYNYYRKAYSANYEMFKIALTMDLRLKNIITLKEDYQSKFNPLIIPLKDNIASLEFNVEEDVTIEPHLSSSENNPTYKVFVKAEAILVDGSAKTYEYTYLFTFENDMILSVKFINQLNISTDEDI